MRRVAICLCTTLVCLLWARDASAQARVGVLDFDGPNSGRVRGAVVAAIEDDGAKVVGSSTLSSAASSTGADLATAEGRVAVAQRLELSALVEGRVSKRGKQFSANLVVYDGASGEELGAARIAGRKPALVRNVRNRFSSELGSAIAQGKPPAQSESEPDPAPEALPESESVAEKAEPEEEGEPEPEDDDAEEQDEADPESGSDQRPRALEASASVRVQARSFEYHDAITALGQPKIDPTPALRLEARWYPAAHFTGGFAANIGLDAHAQMMWPVEVKRDDFAFKAQSKALGAGLRLRIPFGEQGGSEAGVVAGYGLQDFTLADDGSETPGVPSVSYSFVRLGADGRLVLTELFAVDLRAAYLLLLGYGELASDVWYPHTGGGGLEAELGVSISLSKLLAVRAGAGLVRYFFSLKPEPTDAGVVNAARVAGGAIDQTLYGTLGVVLSL